MPRYINHDPQSKLDYCVDWGRPDLNGQTWLDGDVITSSTATCSPPDAVTLSQDSHTDTTAAVWVEGGTLGATVALIFHIATLAGREDDRTIWLQVRNN